MDNIDYTHDTLFVCYFKRNSVGFSTVVVPLHMSHAIYTAVSV